MTLAAKPPPVDVASPEDDLAAKERRKELPNLGEDGPVVTKRELWSYWLYINGNSGNGPVNYSSTLFQALASAAGYDPDGGPCDVTLSDSCLIPFGGDDKTVSSVVLLSNGLTFMFLTIIFVLFGSLADYRNFSRWILIVLTLICWGAQYSSIALTKPSDWKWAMAVYMISCITYGASLVFYIGVFPRLARNTPRTRELRRQFENGTISFADYEVEENMEKNRISNWITINNNVGILICFLLNLAVLLPLNGNPRVDNFTIVLCNSYWVLTGIWWFIFQQPRPGPPVPKSSNGFTVGVKQVWGAVREYKKLPNTFLYLLAFFLLADGITTTISLVMIIQNNHYGFSFLENTYLGIALGVASVISCTVCWYIQRRFKISAKTMLGITNVATTLVPLWGMIGIWTDKFGLHEDWEFWGVAVIFGVFQSPFYAFSQTIMAELTPPGYDNMFFSLFGLSNVVSSVIGPIVVQAIVGIRNNNWEGFTFLFALCLVASLVIFFFVNVDQGRRDAIVWAQEQRAAERLSKAQESGATPTDSSSGSEEASPIDIELEKPKQA